MYISIKLKHNHILYHIKSCWYIVGARNIRKYLISGFACVIIIRIVNFLIDNFMKRGTLNNLLQNKSVCARICVSDARESSLSEQNCRFED